MSKFHEPQYLCNNSGIYSGWASFWVSPVYGWYKNIANFKFMKINSFKLHSSVLVATYMHFLGGLVWPQ